MTDAISFIVLLWLAAEANFLFRTKEDTAADFEGTAGEIRERTDALRALQKAEALHLRQEREWNKLQPSIASARRNQDGSFDRRSKLGTMLNREVPRLTRAREAALEGKRSAESRHLRCEQVPTRRRNRWIRAESFRGACRHSLLLMPLLVGVVSAIRTGAPQDRAGLFVLFLWTCIAGCLTLGYALSTRKKLEA